MKPLPPPSSSTGEWSGLKPHLFIWSDLSYSLECYGNLEHLHKIKTAARACMNGNNFGGRVRIGLKPHMYKPLAAFLLLIITL